MRKMWTVPSRLTEWRHVEIFQRLLSTDWQLQWSLMSPPMLIGWRPAMGKRVQWNARLPVGRSSGGVSSKKVEKLSSRLSSSGGFNFNSFLELKKLMVGNLHLTTDFGPSIHSNERSPSLPRLRHLRRRRLSSVGLNSWNVWPFFSLHFSRIFILFHYCWDFEL